MVQGKHPRTRTVQGRQASNNDQNPNDRNFPPHPIPLPSGERGRVRGVWVIGHWVIGYYLVLGIWLLEFEVGATNGQ
jgi:hypothetical protein